MYKWGETLLSQYDLESDGDSLIERKIRDTLAELNRKDLTVITLADTGQSKIVKTTRKRF